MEKLKANAAAAASRASASAVASMASTDPWWQPAALARPALASTQRGQTARNDRVLTYGVQISDAITVRHPEAARMLLDSAKCDSISNGRIMIPAPSRKAAWTLRNTVSSALAESPILVNGTAIKVRMDGGGSSPQRQQVAKLLQFIESKLQAHQTCAADWPDRIYARVLASPQGADSPLGACGQGQAQCSGRSRVAS